MIIIININVLDVTLASEARCVIRAEEGFRLLDGGQGNLVTDELIKHSLKFSNRHHLQFIIVVVKRLEFIIAPVSFISDGGSYLFQSERFQSDIFPATSSPEPALKAEDWFQGHNAEPKKVSMKVSSTQPSSPLFQSACLSESVLLCVCVCLSLCVCMSASFPMLAYLSLSHTVRYTDKYSVCLSVYLFACLSVSL